jgi:cytochrome c556
MRYLSVLLFAGAALAQGPQYQAVATPKQIMAGIQKPAMDGLIALNKAGGPKDDKEWALAQQDAALLAETAQLLLMGSRPKDQDVWVKSSERLEAAASESAKATEAKDLAAWKTSLNGIGGACRSCHKVHRKQQGQQQQSQ